MQNPLNSRSILLIPILILFGVNMFLAASNLSRWVAEDNLQAFAAATAKSWAGQLGPQVSEAINSLGKQSDANDTRKALDAVVLAGPVVAYRLFDLSDNIIVVSDRLSQNMARPGQPTSPAIAGHAEFGKSRPGGPARRYIDVDVPVRTDGEVTGRLRVYVDQTDTLTLFYASHKSITILSAVFLLSSIAILIFIIWSRLREQWTADDRIRHLAHHDGLTGLKNRTYFAEHLEHAIARADKEKSKVALLCFDVDKFKQVNDTLGHGTGDELLKEFARRLETNLRKSDLVCRLGGDEFAVALLGLPSVAQIVPFADRLCKILSEPYVVNGHKLATSASIGVAVAPDDSLNVSELFNCADLALYRAKAEGRNTVRLFETEMDEMFQRRRRLEQEMKYSIEAREFELHYQPQYDLETGDTLGQEALVRWNHSGRGLLAPEDFIPIAEETGLIMPLSRWILDRACRDAVAWRDPHKVAVNLSASQFKAGSVADLVRDTLDNTGLAPERLELEITETLFLGDAERVRTELQRLKALGVSIVMDDFGTGYSSLSYLASFPFDKIKIDRSFVHNLATNPMAGVIVNTIVGLGRDLDVEITAEGIETPEQEAMLKSFGCGLGQGFLYGRPAPLDGGEPADAAPQPSVVYASFGNPSDLSNPTRPLKPEGASSA